MNLLVTNEGLIPESEYLGASFEVENTVYEVIRVIDGVALFLEDHYTRLVNSIKLQGIDFLIPFSEFKQHLSTLISVNRQTVGNVKFVCFASGNEIKWVFSFIPYSYPTQADYENGVAADLLFAERQNPNAKVAQQEIRDRANQLIAENNLYEVLLVDRDGKITEGSRSNVFFVKSGMFYTAPASMVLEGITRQKVLECLDTLGFPVVEKAISSNETGSFDAAFLTGTSPKVLPIHSVGTHAFEVRNSAVIRLMMRYDQMIQDYIRS